MSTIGGAVLRAGRGWLPAGRLLTPAVWACRHRGMIWLLWLHVAGIAAFATARGMGMPHALQEASLVAVFALAAAHPAVGRRALVHGGFVLAASVAYLVNWRLSEHQAVEISRLVGRLEGLARTDPLTGVPNRRVWEEELPRELERARRMDTGVCVAMIDLDDFKAYNDRFGHQAGDLVLKEAPAPGGPRSAPPTCWPATAARSSCSSCRRARSTTPIRIVERLRAVTPLVTCSVGLACWDFQEDGTELIERADQALYAAKAEGRNRHVLVS